MKIVEQNDGVKMPVAVIKKILRYIGRLVAVGARIIWKKTLNARGFGMNLSQKCVGSEVALMLRRIEIVKESVHVVGARIIWKKTLNVSKFGDGRIPTKFNKPIVVIMSEGEERNPVVTITSWFYETDCNVVFLKGLSTRRLRNFTLTILFLFVKVVETNFLIYN